MKNLAIPFLSLCISLLTFPLASNAGKLERNFSRLMEDYQGVYQGDFDTAITLSAFDDLNINPCSGTKEDCETHEDPLVDVILVLNPENPNPIEFYKTLQDYEAGRTLDLLGIYCDSKIGPLQSIKDEVGKGNETEQKYKILTATFEFDPGKCSHRVLSEQPATLSLSVLENLAASNSFVLVSIDRKIERSVSLTGKDPETKKRVPVKRLPGSSGDRITYLFPDEKGEFTEREITGTKKITFGFPFVYKGYVGANYTWLTVDKLKIRVKFHKDLVKHVGTFERVQLPEK